MSDQSSAMQGKILVIDDDPIITETIEILFDSDVTVLSTDNGRDGIALAAEEKPDLILLDVKMPDMDGYETCSELRLNPDIADIPIIFLTIKNESTDEATGLELGAIDYIAKPIVPQIIKARVKNHLTQKRQRDELENLSTIDALTGIANRRRLDEYLDTEWRRATRNKYSLSILMIDSDQVTVTAADSSSINNHSRVRSKYGITLKTLGIDRLMTAPIIIPGNLPVIRCWPYE